MAINRIPCPECGAGLKSQAGFKVGQTVCCPKCETYFAVEAPVEVDEDEDDEQPKKAKPKAGKKPVKAAVSDDEDDEDDRPKKKKKKKRGGGDEDEEGWSYQNSWIRYAVLGVLLIVMCVLGVMLYLKKDKEAKDSSVRPASVVHVA